MAREAREARRSLDTILVDPALTPLRPLHFPFRYCILNPKYVFDFLEMTSELEHFFYAIDDISVANKDFDNFFDQGGIACLRQTYSKEAFPSYHGGSRFLRLTEPLLR